MSSPSTLSTLPEHADDHWYRYPPTGEMFPSVTNVISNTQSKPWLLPWAAKLAVQWTLDNLNLLTELGREAFEQEARAASARVREVKADAGSYAHHVVAALILSQISRVSVPLPAMPEHLAGQYIDDLPAEDFHEIVMDGFLNFVADFDPEFEAAEMTVFDPDLGVAGTLDMIVRLPSLGITACIDVKTGQDLTGVREQLSSYRRMPQCLLPMGQIEATPATDCGMVLHLRPDYPRGYRLLEVAPADDYAAWNAFRRAVRLFTERWRGKGKPGRVVYPPLPDGSQPPTLLRDLDGDGYGRVLKPLIEAGLNDVADVAKLTPTGCLVLKGIGPKSVRVIAQMLADHGYGPADLDTQKLLDRSPNAQMEGQVA